MSFTQVIPYSPAPSRAESTSSVEPDSPIFVRADFPILLGADSPILSRGDSPNFPRIDFPAPPYDGEPSPPESAEHEGAGRGGGEGSPGGGQRTAAASLSGQSSPSLTERELRNSTSFPDIAAQGPVEAVRREAVQRADSH